MNCSGLLKPSSRFTSVPLALALFFCTTGCKEDKKSAAQNNDQPGTVAAAQKSNNTKPKDIVKNVEPKTIIPNGPTKSTPDTAPEIGEPIPSVEAKQPPPKTTADKLAEETTVHFVDTPLADGIEFLARTHKTLITIDKPALNQNGISVDEPLSHRLAGTSLGSALNIMLEPLGLTHKVQDEVIVITTGPRAPTPKALADAAAKKLNATLDENTTLEFIDTPLSDAVEFIAANHKIQVVVKTHELDEIGIPMDVPVTLSAANVALKSGLTAMLKPLGLEYKIEDEVLKITVPKKGK
jgi:hypothetical protein